MHAGLMSKLLRMRSAWDIVDMPEAKPQIPADLHGSNTQNTVEVVA
jgi:hypothetical protein